MSYGVTDEGFVLKRLDDILSDLISELSTITDPQSGESLTPDLTDENDPLVQIINAFGDGLSDAWEVLQLSYNQYDPLKATGAGLSGLVQLNALTRKAGTETTVTLTMSGDAGLNITAGKKVSTLDDSVVFTLPAWTFDGGGSASVIGTATEKGVLEAAAGEVVKIVTPISGWDSVTNASDAIPGTAEETDTELRARQQNSTSATGSSFVDALYGALSALDGVEYTKVYQNLTLVTDARSIPGKTVAVVIQGGDDDEISETIFQRLPAGAGTFGTTATEQTDTQGIVYPILFSRPAGIDIYVEIEIEVIDTDLWPTDGQDIMKADILTYVTSGASAIGITSGYDRDGYIPGEDVYASELYTPINKQKGIRINSVLVGTSDPGSASSVSIAWNEIASFDTANINITEI